MKQGFEFPALGVLNQFLLGDTVLMESILRELAINQRAYAVSNYPQLFEGHPTIRGVRSLSELPRNTKLIDLTASISGIREDGSDKVVAADKFGNMCREAGFQNRLDHPKLYLTAKELGIVQELKHFFPDKPNIGVALGSAHAGKNWLYMLTAIRKLVRRGYNVFIFSDRLNGGDWKLPKGTYSVIGRSIREMMQYISMMDIMLGVDTGPMHVAGALGIPLVVISFKIFAHLYEMYDNTIVLESNNFTISSGIKGVSIKKVLAAVGELSGSKRKAPVIERLDSTVAAKSHAFIRMRGLGDLLLSLPSIATLRSQNGNADHTYTYITSPAGKQLLDCTALLDRVVGVNYTHGTGGFPLPPPGVDYSAFDTCANMINAVDFLPQSDSVPRAELFAKLVGLDECDFNAPGWKLTIPEAWKGEAWKILKQHKVKKSDRILAFQVDTKGLSRGWPKERQVEFCGMASKRGWKIILLSDVKHNKYPNACINLTGKLSLDKFVGMIAIANVGLCTDSALIHIAGAAGKPAVALFGAVDPELRVAHYDTVFPIVGKAKCVPCNDWQHASCGDKKRYPMCMWSIRANQVYDRIEEVFQSPENVQLREVENELTE